MFGTGVTLKAATEQYGQGLDYILGGGKKIEDSTEGTIRPLQMGMQCETFAKVF